MSFVVPTMLATPADLTEWTQSAPPANASQILRACTTIVFNATKTARYETDSDTGLATDPIVAAALRDATCIQAAAWVTLNIDPATGGTTQTSKAIKSKKFATAAFEYSDAENLAVTAARATAYVSLVPEAVQFLRIRGLISASPSHS